MNETTHRFRFSIVMPVYNVSSYLEEAIGSVLAQTIGFEDNIQLILVNDGSTDGSGEICKRYRDKYPNNIIYIEKENGGVSSARNEGLKHVEGRYVNFLDSDDMWERNAFERVKEFFDSNPDVRIATGRLLFLGKSYKHHLDYKYKKTKVIDISRNYKMPEVSCSKTFIESSLLQDIFFDEQVEFSEDLLLINVLIVQEGKYGVIREAEYYYRKREDGSSAIDQSKNSISWYTVTPKFVFKKLIEKSKELKGDVTPYIQYLLITDLQWRLSEEPPSKLEDCQRREYLEDMKDILQSIDDSIILGQKRMSLPYKAYVLRLKHGLNYYNLKETHSRIAKKINLNAQILNSENKKTLYISGRADEKYINDNYYIYAKDNRGNTFFPEYKAYPIYDQGGIEPTIQVKGYEYIFKLPLSDRVKFSFYVTDGSKRKRKIKMIFGKFSRLTSIENSFFSDGEYIIKNIDDRICVYDYNVKTYIASSYRYNKQIEKKANREIVKIRKKIAWKKLHAKKPIWIISDRSYVAGDNGEALFEYLMNSNLKNDVDIYFLLEKESPHYKRIKKIGRVITFGSRKHKVLVGAASMIISSHADEWVINPYGSDRVYYSDLRDYKYCFLQHGVTKDDLSKWLHKYNKRIDLFNTATLHEYKSIIDGRYGYDGSVVKLTGFARYDKLCNRRENLVVFAPTWRKSISKNPSGDSHRPYNSEFKETDYYRFYNNLINDSRIIAVMEKNNYKGVFCLHPTFDAQASDFDGNKFITIGTGISYNDLISRSSLLITDYSSVAFDFAYLRTPMIYTQYDSELFYKNHSYTQGYFDYKKDGFGPVCYDYETSVKMIVDEIETGCIEREMYAERVKNTFAFFDRKNCRRIVEELLRKGDCEKKSVNVK